MESNVDITKVRKSLFLPAGFPKIITLCGSTRFRDEFQEAQKRLTFEGNIVISVGTFGHLEGLDMDGPLKRRLDKLHLCKIDISDEVFVVNAKRKRCPCCERWFEPDEVHCGCPIPTVMLPYVGESTRREIAYAEVIRVPVRYLNPPG